MHATAFFLPGFIKAIHENTEESFRSIMSEPAPGIFTFEILQPDFCEALVKEVYLQDYVLVFVCLVTLSFICLFLSYFLDISCLGRKY